MFFYPIFVADFLGSKNTNCGRNVVDLNMSCDIILVYNQIRFTTADALLYQGKFHGSKYVQ